LLDALNISWRAGNPHIRCPYPGHSDANPSWHWDGTGGKIAPIPLASRARIPRSKGGNIAAIIVWLKTRANWRERTVPDDPTPGTDAESNSAAVLVLPGNTRDAELTPVLREAQEKYFVRKRRRR
jgi:hypothetical protein